MADAQDLKSWDLKKSCRFESDHRHQMQAAAAQAFGKPEKRTASESASEIKTSENSKSTRVRLGKIWVKTGLAARSV